MTSRTTPSKKPGSRKPKFADTGHGTNYCDIAYKWAQEAAKDAKGKRHNRWARLAARRFLDDLKRSRPSGTPFSFDPWHGNNVCYFMEQLPHIEGQWETPTIVLEPAQIFMLVAIFGFRNAEGGRRFTDVYIEMARKGAKSTITGGVALYCLTCEEENGPQVIIGATTREQADKVFKPSKGMVDRTSALRDAFGLTAWANSISCDENGGFIQPINAKSSTQDGWNPHVGILDELHAHKERGLHDVIKSAFGSRKNPLMWRITTAGFNPDGVCYEQRTLVTKILDGVIEADHYFGIIFTLDEDDDPLDETKWIKANPMLGVTPSMEGMRSYAKEAKASPGVMGEFKTKRLNVWTTAKGGWLNMELWKRLGSSVDLDDLAAVPCFGGIDLAATSDLTAFVLVWLHNDRLKMWGRYYLPEEATKPRAERGDLTYTRWAEQGHLVLTPGDVTDYTFVERDVERALSQFNVQEIGYDPWNATQTVNNLMEAGAPMIEVRQGAKSFHPAMQEFERRVKAGSIDHDGNPVLTWAASNIVARHDANMNMAPDKKNSMDKIDPIVAALMAVGRLVVAQPAEQSIYETATL